MSRTILSESETMVHLAASVVFFSDVIDCTFLCAVPCMMSLSAIRAPVNVWTRNVLALWLVRCLSSDTPAACTFCSLLRTTYSCQLADWWSNAHWMTGKDPLALPQYKMGSQHHSTLLGRLLWNNLYATAGHRSGFSPFSQAHGETSRTLQISSPVAVLIWRSLSFKYL